MDPIKTIGNLLDDTANKDAIHVAIMPVVAGENLRAGEHIGLNYSGQAVKSTSVGQLVKLGIVDPFLIYPVDPGERFWMFLYPGTVTGMRHEWSHPEIDKTNKAESEKWIEDFAKRWALDYSELIRVAESGKDDTWVTADGVDLHGAEDLGEDHDLFWHHMEIITGKTFNSKHRAKLGWSCSC